MERTPIEQAITEALVWFAREGYLSNKSVIRRLLTLPAPASASAGAVPALG
jgi:hypothetical protein